MLLNRHTVSNIGPKVSFQLRLHQHEDVNGKAEDALAQRRSRRNTKDSTGNATSSGARGATRLNASAATPLGAATGTQVLPQIQGAMKKANAKKKSGKNEGFGVDSPPPKKSSSCKVVRGSGGRLRPRSGEGVDAFKGGLDWKAAGRNANPPAYSSDSMAETFSRNIRPAAPIHSKWRLTIVSRGRGHKSSAAEEKGGEKHGYNSDAVAPFLG